MLAFNAPGQARCNTVFDNDGSIIHNSATSYSDSRISLGAYQNPVVISQSGTYTVYSALAVDSISVTTYTVSDSPVTVYNSVRDDVRAHFVAIFKR